MAFTARFGLSIAAHVDGAPDLGSSSYEFSSAAASWVKSFTEGVGLNQANKVFVDTAATTTSYDLDAGTGVATLGTLLDFTRIVAVGVYSSSANAANITVGGDFILSKYLTGWVEDALAIPVHPGGVFSFVAPSATGVAVTVTTGDVITVTCPGTEAFGIVILGSKA